MNDRNADRVGTSVTPETAVAGLVFLILISQDLQRSRTLTGKLEAPS